MIAIPYPRLNFLKTVPFKVAHTCIEHDYAAVRPPPPPQGSLALCESWTMTRMYSTSQFQRYHMTHAFFVVSKGPT